MRTARKHAAVLFGRTDGFFFFHFIPFSFSSCAFLRPRLNVYHVGCLQAAAVCLSAGLVLSSYQHLVGLYGALLSPAAFACLDMGFLASMSVSGMKFV